MQQSAAKKRKLDESPAGGVTYQVDETIMCKYGTDGLEYKAKILKVSSKGYEIHYQV
jgi:hypothetical protein